VGIGQTVAGEKMVTRGLLRAGFVALVCGLSAPAVAESAIDGSSAGDSLELARSEFKAARAALLLGDVATFDLKAYSSRSSSP